MPDPKIFLEKHGNKSMHVTTLLFVMALLGIDLTGSEFGLARRSQVEAVDTRLTEHIMMAEATLDGVSDELKRIRAYTEIVPELKDLLRLRCMGTPNLDATIDRLKREFKSLTGQDYQEPPCERLLAPEV